MYIACIWLVALKLQSLYSSTSKYWLSDNLQWHYYR